MMLPALKLSLNGLLSFRDIRFFAVIRQTIESSVGELPTEVGEAQECEGLWFSLARCFGLERKSAPNSISRVSSACNSKSKLSQPCSELSKELFGVWFRY